MDRGSGAKAYIKSRYLAEAKEELSKDLTNFNQYFNLLIITSSVYYLFGNHARSLDYAKLLITYHPKHWEGYALAARNIIALKQFKKAIEQTEIGLEKFPTCFDLLHLHANACQLDGDHKKALQSAKEFIDRHPDKWHGHAIAAFNLIKLRKYQEAIAQTELGIQRFPNCFDLLHLHANACQLIGDHKSSLQHAEIMISHCPNKWEGYEIAIQSAIKMTKLKTARQIAEKGILKTSKDKSLLAYLGDIAFAQGDIIMHDKYERDLSKRFFSEYIFDKLSLTPQSIQSQLKGEYTAEIRDQNHLRGIKPDLYIVAGFSACGKSTLLNSTFYAIDKIFARKKTRIKMLAPETIDFLNQRRSIISRNYQGLLFTNAFTDIEFLQCQKILPQKTCLELDLTHLLLKGDWSHFGWNCLRPEDLVCDDRVRNYLRNFFAIPFFNKFNSISIASIEIGFNKNMDRYTQREGEGFYLGLGMQNYYNQAMKLWYNQISTLKKLDINNVITEAHKHYIIRQKQ